MKNGHQIRIFPSACTAIAVGKLPRFASKLSTIPVDVIRAIRFLVTAVALLDHDTVVNDHPIRIFPSGWIAITVIVLSTTTLKVGSLRPVDVKRASLEADETPTLVKVPPTIIC